MSQTTSFCPVVWKARYGVNYFSKISCWMWAVGRRDPPEACWILFLSIAVNFGSLSFSFCYYHKVSFMCSGKFGIFWVVQASIRSYGDGWERPGKKIVFFFDNCQWVIGYVSYELLWILTSFLFFLQNSYWTSWAKYIFLAFRY